MKKFLLFCCLIIAAPMFAQADYTPFDNPVDQAVLNDLFSDNQQTTNFYVTTEVTSNISVTMPNYELPEAIPWQRNDANNMLYENINDTGNINFVNNTVNVEYKVVATPYNGFTYHRLE